jgi:hypothetical protein
MVGTLCIESATCGIIADMTRVLTGLAAWLAGTALAVCLAWFGANMVVRDAGVSPGIQVINADPPAAAAVQPTPPPAPPTPPEADGPEPPTLIIHNDRAREKLGWRPRPAETTIVETAESLRDLGLLEKR